MDSEYTPQKCGYAMNVSGVIICRLACRPCHEPCAKEQQDKAFAVLAKTIKECKHDG